ncbi:MAG: RNA polymerase sigma factor [Bacteroidales bacterium]
MLTKGEQYILDLVKSGDRKAFEYLFISYYKELCSYTNRIVRNQSVTEDIVMNIYVKFWENCDKININTSISGYLFQSAHNHALNYLTRKHKRLPEFNSEILEKLTSVSWDDSSDPFEKLSFEELSCQIKSSIESLPAECKKIFSMSRIDGMSHREIAQKLGISENTVKVQIYRALKKIRNALS